MGEALSLTHTHGYSSLTSYILVLLAIFLLWKWEMDETKIYVLVYQQQLTIFNQTININKIRFVNSLNDS